MVYYGALVYLLINTVEGLLRYTLLAAGLPFLIYSRDAFIVVVVLWFLLSGLRRRSCSLPLAIVLLIICFWSIIACKYVHNVRQTAFGIKLFLPHMLGIIAAPALLDARKNTAKWIALLWLLAVSGVFFSAVVDVPWSGLSYEVGGVEIEGTRSWTIGGVPRLAGFGRSSTEVAIQILFFATYMVCFGRSRVLRLAVWIISAPALLLATTRAAIIAYGLVSLFLIVQAVLPSLECFWKQILSVTAALMVVLPLIPSNSLDALSRMSGGGVANIKSLYMRMEDTWPEAFDLLKQEGSPVFGRGIGGISIPQRLFEQEAHNPGDNLFLYLLLVFGWFSLAIIIAIVIGLQALKLSGDMGSLFAFCAGLALFGIGLLLNGIEFSCPGVFVGAAFSYVFARLRRRIMECNSHRVYSFPPPP